MDNQMNPMEVEVTKLMPARTYREWLVAQTSKAVAQTPKAVAPAP